MYQLARSISRGEFPFPLILPPIKKIYSIPYTREIFV